MDAIERLDQELVAAEQREDFDEAAGWAKMLFLADPSDLRWKGMIGLMLVKSAMKHKDAGDFRASGRAARQARHVMADFRYPAGVELIDGVIETAEQVFQFSCEQLHLPYPGPREGIDSTADLTGYWINSLDGYQTRAIDFVRLAGSLEGA